MATSVSLPALGESVTEGTVTRWLKQPGDEVAVDEPLLEVSTDKVDTEIPSPVGGTLLEVKVSEDETVEVGAELATVGEAGESGGEADAAQQQPAAQEQPAAPAVEESSGGQEQQTPAAEPEPASAVPPPQAQPSGQAQGEASAESGTSVSLPALGESVTEGTVTRWLKQPGDEVAVDEPLLEVSTDKVDTEIPSPVGGTLLEVKVSEDETVEVGAELAVVGTGEAPAAAAAPEPEPTPEPEPEPEPEPTPKPQAPPATTQPPAAATGSGPAQAADEQPAPGQPGPAPSPEPAPKPSPKQPTGTTGQAAEETPYVTPLVRKLAAQHDVDLSTVTGSGIGGRIRKQDVLAAAEAAKTEPAPSQPASSEATSAAAAESAAAEPSPLRGTTEKLTRMRKVIAKRVHESLQQTAQLTTVVEIDVTSVARLRQRVKDDFARREGVKLSFLPFFAKASVEALKQHPKINASIDVEAGEVTYHDRENLVLAVDTDQGLLVPVIKDAGDLNIAGLSRKISDVAERARTNKLTPDEVTGGTFTLTNTGSRGALFDTPIFFQPQVGILGTGSVVKRPMVIDDPELGETIAVRHMVYFALSYDHRLIDGADAARFLATIKQRLENGRFEADLGLS